MATNLGVFLFYSDLWNRARSYARSVVSASWGLPDWGNSGITPAEAGAQLDNRDVSYSPDDTRSPLYGLVGRNTPGRIYLTPELTTGAMADTSDAFGRSSSSAWGTSDQGGAWTVFGNGTTASSDFNVSGGFGTMSVAAANEYRAAVLAATDAVRDVDMSVTFKVAQAATAPLNVELHYRGVTITDTAHALVRLTQSNSVQVEAYARDGSQVGITHTVSGLTHTGTNKPLRVRVLVAGRRVHVKVWDVAGAEPDDWKLIATDDTESPQAGSLGVRATRSSGNTNTSPVVFSFDDWETVTLAPIADGAVSSWLPDRDTGFEPPDVIGDRGTGGDAWTDISITGPSQRVNSSKAALSAMRGTMKHVAATDANLVAYWPLEDEPGTTTPVSGLPGGIPGRIISGTPVWRADLAIQHGSLGLVDCFASDCTLSFPLAGLGLADQHFQFEILVGAEFGVTSNGILQLMTSASNVFLQITPGMGGDGFGHHIVYFIEQNGSNVDYTVYKDGALYTGPTSIPGTLGTPQEIRIGVVPSGNATDVWALGHLAAFSNFSDPAVRGLAADGYDGETSATRFLRLCDEHNVPAAVIGIDLGDDSAALGPQPIDTLPELLAEITRTDLGLMYDGRAWDGLEYRTGRSLYNQSAALELTYGVNVHPPIRPATDDLGIANDSTATNPHTDASVHVEKTSGALNVNDPTDDPEGISRVETGTDANPSDDARLADIAGWNLRTGTWPGARYKNVTVSLLKHPELLPAVMSLRPGDLLTIAELDADLVELLILGGAHSLGAIDHTVTFNCVPAGPYRILTVSDSSFNRVGSRTAVLAADYAAGATSMSVSTTGGLWTTTDEPFHIRVGGMVLNVTNVSGASSPQTFTVDATPVNGVSRDLDSDGPATLTRINVEHPLHVGR